jgi:hypothetical protein
MASTTAYVKDTANMNKPCSCGSGKKKKKCCARQVPSTNIERMEPKVKKKISPALLSMFSPYIGKAIENELRKLPLRRNER